MIVDVDIKHTGRHSSFLSTYHMLNFKMHPEVLNELMSFVIVYQYYNLFSCLTICSLYNMLDLVCSRLNTLLMYPKINNLDGYSHPGI
jgi:hypothetical protein